MTATFLILFGLSTLAQGAEKPNVIVIYADDLGYGDLGCYGATKQMTPVLDQMAKEGMRLTDFYSTCSVCTPSRASLLTGSYPRRVNMHVGEKSLCVLFEGSRKGLNPDEVTIADLLRGQGYATMCIGKWHLGDHPDFLPTSQGFDAYFGIPYSNDMGRKHLPLPLVRDETVIEAPVNQTPLTQLYTEEAVRFIKANKDQPFFLYLPHTAVHLPLFPGKDFLGKSENGKYGDWVQEVDWSTGEILKALKEEGIDERTMVVFSSDNGSRQKGSNAPLLGKKGRTDEGGMRVPCVIRYPKAVPAGATSSEVITTMDLFPTIAHLAGASLPDKKIDGHNIWSILAGKKDAESPYEAFYYYQMDQLQAVRSGKWKLFVAMESKKRNWGKPEGTTPIKLFDLEADVGESIDVHKSNPKVVKRLLSLAENARVELGDGERKGSGQRPAGWVEEPSPRLMVK